MRDHLRETAEGVVLEPLQFLFDSPHVACNVELARYAESSFTPGRPLLEAALDLTERIYSDFEFDPHATTIATPLADVLKGRRGVCQDFAHIMIACLRTLGLPARYVSGYLLTQPPPGRPRLIGADASHAWVSVYLPGRDGPGDWADFCPTNGRQPGEDYVTLAIGRDYSDVSPMRGVLHGGARHTLERERDGESGAINLRSACRQAAPLVGAAHGPDCTRIAVIGTPSRPWAAPTIILRQ